MAAGAGAGLVAAGVAVAGADLAGAAVPVAGACLAGVVPVDGVCAARVNAPANMKLSSKTLRMCELQRR